MKKCNGISTATCRIIVAVTLLLGCYGFGSSMTFANSDASFEEFTKDDIPYIDDVHVIEVFTSATNNNDYIAQSLTKHEQIELPIITGFAIANSLKGHALEGEDSYNTILAAIETIQSGISYIESTSIRQLLYLNTKEAGIIPVRYYLAQALEYGLKFQEADSAYIDMVRDVARDFGVVSEEFVFWTNQAAAAINERYKNYEQAIVLMKPALNAALNSKKVSDKTSFDFLIAYSQKNYRAGHFDEALKYGQIVAQKALEHYQLYQANRLLGQLNVSNGNFSEAEKYFALAAQNSPSLPEFLANSYDYANLLKTIGRIQDAIALLTELEKYLEDESLDNADKFNYYENLGVATSFANPTVSKEAFANAETYINSIGYDVLIRHIINSQIYPNENNSFAQISALDRVLFVYNNFVKNEPRLLSEILYLFGDYYLRIRDYDKAQKYLVNAYGSTLEYAESDPFPVRILEDLCTLYNKTSQNGLWKVSIDALIATSKSMGTDSERHLNAIASALDYALTTNDIPLAEEYLNLYSGYRPNHFDTECYKIRYAIAQGRYDEARVMLAQLDSDKSDNTPDISGLWQMLYAEMKHPDVAIYARRNFENYRNEILRQLLFMSSEERNNLKEELTKRRDEAIRLIDITPDMIDIAFDYSLLIKGLLLNTQSNLRSYLSSSPEVTEDWEKLQELRKELNRAEAQGNNFECRNLREEIASRERYILNDYVDFELFKQSFDTRSVANVKKNRPNNSVLIDFVKYHDAPATYYGAFVVDTFGQSHFEIISKAWTLEKMPFGAWIELDELLRDAMAVYFCPDDKLSCLLLEYQCDENKMPYGNRYEIHRVFHLADIPKGQTIGDAPLAIGVSDHNSPIGSADVIYRGDWVDMPNVKSEITQFQKILKKKNPTILYNDQATEERFKNLNKSDVSVLHISTHGFYRSLDSLLEASSDETNPDFHIAHRALSVGKNELSGLVLRGGNISWKSAEITDEEDNLLTSEEIEQLSFPHLNLVVLSACNTGLGNSDAEGVWGLQRAFRIAGCKSLICTLNKVDDYWTAQFMEELYKNAANGMTIYDSFHSAHQTLWETPECPRELLSSFILIE